MTILKLMVSLDIFLISSFLVLLKIPIEISLTIHYKKRLHKECP